MSLTLILHYLQPPSYPLRALPTREGILILQEAWQQGQNGQVEGPGADLARGNVVLRMQSWTMSFGVLRELRMLHR